MKVQFFYDDEPTEVNAELFNDLRHFSWTAGINSEEGIDSLTGKFARVYKVQFMDGPEDVYVQADMLAAIANGDFEVISEEE